MLAASDRNVVISEAPSIDSTIRSATDQNVDRIRWIINAFAPIADESDRRYFVKFDSWSTLHLDKILAAYPDVPWIFMYRNPVEVIVSLLRQPGLHALPGMIDGTIPDASPADLLLIPREEYCARVIGRYCEIMLRFADRPKGHLINYTQLPAAVTGEIRQHFGMTFSDDEALVIANAAEKNAKSPQVKFTPDSETKRAEASEKVREAAEAWVMPFYERLEALRLAAKVK
jgi:hypothetical protein